MKKSRQIDLIGLLSAAALGAVGCSDRNTIPQRCVDEKQVVVADVECDKAEERRRSSGGAFFYPYRWYYGGQGFGIGQRAVGGNFQAPAGLRPVRAGASSRWGFGSSSRSGIS